MHRHGPCGTGSGAVEHSQPAELVHRTQVALLAPHVLAAGAVWASAKEVSGSLDPLGQGL